MKKRFTLVISLMVISLFGIIIVQGLWISYAIHTEENRFNQQVFSAMSSALEKAEKKNAFEFIDHKLALPNPVSPIDVESKIEIIEDLEELEELRSLNKIRDLKFFNSSLYDSIINSNTQKVIINDSLYIYSNNTPERRPDYYLHKHDNSESRILFLNVDSAHKVLSSSFSDSSTQFTENFSFNYDFNIDSIEAVIAIENEKLVKEKEKIVERTIKIFNDNMEEWVVEFNSINNEKRLKYELPKYYKPIKSALSNKGIDLDFRYQVHSKQDNKNVILYSSDESESSYPEIYTTEFYPDNIFSQNLFLTIDFPGKQKHIYSKVVVLITGSVLFTLIILITFAMTIYYMQKQKKLSEVKSDFINNMTHEFKTPIATIRLATDAIKSPKILNKQTEIIHFTDIIRQENKRMNNQVERVLQMALIDQGQLHIELHNSDIHNIINNCVDVIKLQFKQNEGNISESLRANCSKIDIDEDHMANVINNILENAIKYCDKAPNILVESFNNNNTFFLRITDNGIGMTKDIQKHIFDKFYRKPTGNVHNIKGFGLGLSYVKAVIDNHNGNITVDSEPGNGSIFTIGLPCKNQ